MAKAFFNAIAPEGWRASSAGTEPAAGAHPRTRSMLAEVGFALPSHPPRRLTKTEMDSAAICVTMGCLDSASCPAHLRELPVLDWALPDPARLDDDGFRQVRDTIRSRVAELVRGLPKG